MAAEEIAAAMADLAVAAALISSLTGAPLPADAVYFGEVSLSGSVRPVAHMGPRLKEAAKLGFHRAVCPMPGNESGSDSGMRVNGVASLATLVADIAASKQNSRASPTGG